MGRMSSQDESSSTTRDELSRALRDALDEAEAITDSETAYRQASWLVDVLSAATTASGRLRAAAARRIKDEGGLSLSQLGERLGVSKARAADMLRVPQSRRPEPPPVVAAIVTSELGVLAGRRNDETPPWTFIAGQLQPGESPGDTTAREVKEETGLEVIPGRVIGRRVHPETGRNMVYLAARPADPQQLEIHVGDEDELAEVRWLTLAEAEQLLPGMFAPVHAYLSRALRPRHPPG
jgi:8-oxo-dGTP pyrophosphatase MutT (NUDIX family)